MLAKIILLFLLFAAPCFAQPISGTKTWVEEEDGSPSIVIYKLKVTNGGLTDNADGTGSLTTGSGSGDVTAVGDCLTGACFDGASGNTLTLKGATSGTTALKPTAIAGTTTITLPAETGTVITSVTALGGDVTGTIGATVVGDDSHAHTTTTISGIDISADTNLAVTAPIVLTDDTLSLTVAKDIVAGVGLSGGEDNVLPGADADTILALDLTEIASLTWGSGTFTTMTFDAGVTDPVITASSGDLAVSTGTFTLLNTGLHLLDTDASHDLIIKPGSNLLADRTLTITTGDADRTVTINGDATISGTNTGDNTVATTGDSATSFFSTGVLEVAIGGTGTTTSTGTGAVVLGTSPTIDAGGSTSLEIPNGVNPTVSVAGQISVDSSATSGSAFRFYGDAQYTLPAWQRLSFCITNPTASADRAIGSFPANITIRQIRVLAEDGTNIIGGLDEADANGLNTVAVDSDITATAGTTTTDDGTLTNPTIDANDQLFWHTTSVSGTPTKVVVTVYFSYDAVN